MKESLRRIDGVLYEGRPSDQFRARVLDLGHGHYEVSIREEVHWQERKVLNADENEAWDRHLQETEDDRREANRERSARRATSSVRQGIKQEGFDTMLTLTYRSNQTDLALCKAHLKEFTRRMRRLLPDWQRLAVFERQKRGAWHVHMAIHRLPVELPASNGVKVKSFNVVRKVWAAVAGDGNVDVSRRKRWSGASPGRIARYLSKYLTKAFLEGEDHKNRYSATTGIGKRTERRVEVRRGGDLAELIKWAYDRCHYAGCECWAAVHKARTGELGGDAADPPELRPWRERAYGFFLTTGPTGREIAA